MTATLERSVESGTAWRGGPARRAVIRWAWRLFRREWRQQILVLLLLTLAVTATILGAAVGSNTPPPVNAGFGNADHLVNYPGNDPNLSADIDAVRQRFGTVEVVESRRLATGTTAGAQLRAQDPRGPYGSPMLALVSGRYPSGPGEVAMTDGLARTFGVHVGDPWRDGGQTYRVVGLVENPQNLLDSFALVAPGALTAPDTVTVLFRASWQSVAEYTFPGGATPLDPQNSSGFAPAVVVLLLAIGGLLFIGLVAVAGFSVMAQRRLRGLGMLSALGATDRDVRLVMVANGAVVGIVSALIGTVLGLGAWIAYAPTLQADTHHRVSWTQIPWWLVAAIVVLAVLTAVLAARRPARAVSRLSAMAALSGRPATPRPVHRSALPGLVLVAAGPTLLAFSGGWGASSGKDSLFKLGGILATAVGLLLLAPAGVAVLGGVARRAPVAVRLALRDIGRYRARSGAALAAISFAVFLAMTVGLLATGRYADPVDYFGPNLPANQLVVYAPDTDGSDKGGPTSSAPAADPQSVTDGIASALGTTDVLRLESVDVAIAQGFRGFGGLVYLATPDVLRHYGIDPATIDPAALVVTSRRGLDRLPGLQLRTSFGPEHPGCEPGHCIDAPKIQEVPALPTDTGDPNLLITAHAVSLLHLDTHPAAWLIQTARPLTDAQINSARQAATGAGMTIETKNEDPSLDGLRHAATAGGVLLALAVLAMTLGLIRSESAGDLRTLTANGAGGPTRRTITAATAGALGLCGAVLGTAVAYLAVAALFRSQLSERMAHPPVLDLALVVVGLPLVAAVGGWLLGGREPPLVSRQPIE